MIFFIFNIILYHWFYGRIYKSWQNCWLSKGRRKAKMLTKMNMHSRRSVKVNIKRRDKRRNNSATFNKRDCGIGWAVGSNQASGSLRLRIYTFRAFGRSYACVCVHVCCCELNPRASQWIIIIYHRTYCYHF